jgi:ABC-type Fe3+/spermidine/putrescine transport system ATPase subunit
MLHLEDIWVRLGGFQLRGINLHIRPGEYRVLLGSTGTGKTVLLETIAGLHHPGRGKILLKGRDITHLAPEERHVGVVYQEYALFPHMSVFRNIAFGLQIKRIDKEKIKTAVEETSRFLDIAHILSRMPGHLSGGERQRVALARALVLKPHMLLLDEPLSAVDRLTRERLQTELKRIHQELGITILHITHDLDEAFLLADHLAVMRAGAVLQEGTPEEISAHPESRFVAELTGVSNFVPARVIGDGMIYVDGMGLLDPELLSPAPGKTLREIFITIPGWAIELFPGRRRQPFLWRGKATIASVNRGDGHVALTLALLNGTRLQTTFSRRETARFPFSLTAGVSLECGILRRGIHWVPRDEPAPHGNDGR